MAPAPATSAILDAMASAMLQYHPAWWVKDEAGRYVAASKALEERFHLVGRTTEEVFGSDSAAILRSTDSEAFCDGPRELTESAGGCVWRSTKFKLAIDGKDFLAGFACKLAE